MKKKQLDFVLFEYLHKIAAHEYKTKISCAFIGV